ncbi:mannitol dehydrogenase family protein [Alphaproteobacteria bacterium]|nr:mannitol dehydrogenase family protein [Alphaproteobacteria bacterium]
MPVTSPIHKTYPLNNFSLPKINRDIQKPLYDREKLTAGILHIGVGNFHRAHLSWYIHRLMQQGLDLNWAILGSGTQEFDKHMREKLQNQDFLSSLIELDPQGKQSCEIIGSMIDYVPVEEGNQSLIKAMVNPEIKIVSLTVTEGGYFLDQKAKLQLDHPDLIHDIENENISKTVFGVIVNALNIRKNKGIKPFTGLSCDNLIQNGDKLKQVVLGIASKRNSELAKWIEENCTFPNSMVDCIVPRTSDVELKIVKNLGIEDQVPVSHEDFRQWVIEDKFISGRPELEKVGVQFTDNVHSYEDQKIRILNGGHQILANASELLNIKTIREAMKNEIIVGFLKKVEKEEIIPHVKPVPGFTPKDYLNLIINRFANKSIQDTVRRVAFDGHSRHAGFLMPSILDGIKNNKSINGLALVEALWARMCEGTREDLSIIEPNDPHWEKLNICAKKSQQNPLIWLEQKEIYGNISKNNSFQNSFSNWLQLLYQNGVESTLKTYLS